MYMAIRRYRVLPAQMDEVVRRVDEGWLDRARALPGFVTYYVTRDGEDRLTSISAFLDEATSQRAAEASAEWVGGHLMDLDVSFLDSSDGPVVVHGGG